ncbi:hypothetical protein [Streptomyces viridochromogenes]|uniref:hypothetical protein n=1 Tax=Streptomyces viridochromogenes TaxID=1938 RepID=UPI0013313267|nr:hypothetical protein [Streptomyces viridochromogenes]
MQVPDPVVDDHAGDRLGPRAAEEPHADNYDASLPFGTYRAYLADWPDDSP